MPDYNSQTTVSYRCNLAEWCNQVPPFQCGVATPETTIQWLVQTTEADHVASMTTGAHPDLVQCWNDLCNETAEIRHLHSMVQSVLISVGTYVVERNKRRGAIDDPATLSADLDLSWPTFVLGIP